MRTPGSSNGAGTLCVLGNNETPKKYTFMKDELLQKVLEWAQTITDFANAEIPLYVQELLTYYTFYHGVILSLNILIFAPLLYFSIKGIKASYAYTQENQGIDVVFGISVCAGGALVSCIMLPTSIITQGLSLIKILVAPRVWLLEYLTNMLQT
jgi:hypothetical protein